MFTKGEKIKLVDEIDAHVENLRQDRIYYRTDRNISYIYIDGIKETYSGESIEDRRAKYNNFIENPYPTLKQLYKDFILDIKEVYEICKYIFKTENIDHNEDYIIIKFPEIAITNSMGRLHIIKDIYVKITIECRWRNYLVLAAKKSDLTDEYLGSPLSIHVSGARTTLSLEEFYSMYIHSHLPSTDSPTDFNSFCLGASYFSTIKYNLQLSPTKENWELFFLSIEKYLSWESLEGGPHTLIKNIGNNLEPSGLMGPEIIRFIDNIPTNIIDISESGATVKIDESIIIPILEKNKFYNLYSLNKSKVTHDLKNFYGRDFHLIFKGVKVRATIETNGEEKQTITKKMISDFSKKLTNILNTNIKLLKHESRNQRA